MYKLFVKSKVKDQLKKLPKHHQKALLEALRDIAAEPTLGKPLTRELTGRYTYRVGPYRIIYQINNQNKMVFVSSAGHRKDVYIK